MKENNVKKKDLKGVRRFAISILCVLSLLITFMPSINAHASTDYHGNAFEFATSLGRLSGLYAEDGGIDFAGDEDYISFIPASSGTILIYTTGSTDTYGALYNSSHRSLISDDDGNGRGNFKIEYDVSQGSTYYIVIKGYNSRTTGDYELVIELMTSSSDDDDDDISPDNLERRSDIVGDTRSSAYSLSDASRDYEGIFMMNDEDDIDYFRFTPRVSGDLNIYSSGSTDVKGTLYSSSGSSLISDDDSGRGNNFDFTYAVEAGVKYYLKVTGFEEGEYVLNFEYYGNSDNFEYRSDMIGDSKSSAYNLVEASSNYSGLFMINEEGDNDYFKFTPSVTGTVTIYTTGNVDTRGYLYSSSGSSLTNNDDGGSGSNFSITYDVTRNESYYIRVKGYDSDEVGEYGLVFEYEEEVIPLNPNNKEPNGDEVGNSFSSAYELDEASSDYTGYFVMNSSSDNDYFEFVSNYTGTVTIHTESNINTRGYLYDEDETKIADNDDADNDLNFRITCDVERGKTYYLRVKTFSGYEGEYALIFEYEGTTTIDDEDIPGGLIDDESDWIFKGILVYADDNAKNYLDANLPILANNFGKTRIIINSKADLYNWKWRNNFIVTKSKIEGALHAADYSDHFDEHSSTKEDELENYLKDATNIANRLVASNSNIKIYLTFPAIHYKCSPELYENPYKELYQSFKERLDSDIWNNNIEGFYFATESIENYYDSFDESIGELNNFGNKCYGVMKDLSQMVHNDNKKFLWIPFLGGGDDGDIEYRTKIISYIGNQTNVFDYIVCQSGYPFAEKKVKGNYANISKFRKNLNYIALCASENLFYKRDISGVYCPKISNTKIGFELEYSPLDKEWSDVYVDNYGTSLNRYNECLFKLREYQPINEIPIVYYVGTLNNLEVAIEELSRQLILTEN